MPYISRPPGRSARSKTRDLMAGAVELLRGGQAGRSAADDGHSLAGARRRRLGHDPAFVEAAIGDRHLDLLDRDGIFVDAQHAGRLARRGTDAAGELGKVVRRVQPVAGLAPLVAIDQVVPVGNDVSQRAAGVAKRNAAVHAPRALRLQFLRRQDLEKLVVMLESLGHGLLGHVVAAILHESANVTHGPPRAPPSASPAASSSSFLRASL